MASYLVESKYGPIEVLLKSISDNTTKQAEISVQISELKLSEANKLEDISDFGPGAKTINAMLLGYLRHDEFSLDVVEDGYRLIRKGG